MTSMEPPLRTASYKQTVKCSSCAAEIDLSLIAEHECAPSVPALRHQPYHDHYRIPQNHPPFDQHSEQPSPPRNNRPVLPKLDSSLNGRSGLRPSEAASIAHDLGLPSPLSAGGPGHRSRPKPRKPLVVRPPSPDIPISQDCAFPPFPVKPKRSPSKKDSKAHKSQSNSRSSTSTHTGQHSSSLSTSSSLYSTSSGPTKRRTSNNSSGQRSRRGTADESMSIPPVTPISPQHSTYMPFSREQSINESHAPPALVTSDSYNSSAPSSSVSSMPPTPSWAPELRESIPKIVSTPTSEVNWVPTEQSIPEEQLSEVQPVFQSKLIRDLPDTFDKILSPSQLTNSGPMFDNPPREPLYKSKRPAPLLQPKQISIDNSGMPLSARLPPPPPPPGGLTRTLTNLFGRKRSKSSAASNMPLPSFDSPRMRALAPDPPERPKRGDSLWDDAVTNKESSDDWSAVTSPGDEVSTSPIVVPESTDQSKHDKPTILRETGEFNFNFVEEKSPQQADHQTTIESNVQHDQPSFTTPVIINTQYGPSEQDLRHASIDSASSYGSIGFSTHRTASSKSSDPNSSVDITGKFTPIVEVEPPLAPLPTTTTIDLILPERVQSKNAVPESPTDPFYHAGRLTPVPEAEHRGRSQSPASGQSISTGVVSTPPIPQTRDSSKSARPVTPSGIKGKCRGCSKNILTGQKSVVSADGRLTGKYHKDCFACQTCKEPFTTADFYVFEDYPYCSHHYHTLCNTLCVGCGKGIEGQYLETFDVTGVESKKFHAKCLQCVTCKTQLDADYFEFHGRVYCERDAFRAASGPRKTYDTVPSRPSPLVREYINSEEPGLKGRFPERRTTKLIMT